MNRIKIFLLLTMLTMLTRSVNFLANHKAPSDDQKVLEAIYKACPSVKASLAGIPDGLYSSQARILLAILAGQPGEIESCSSLADLQASLGLFEKCIVQANLKDLELANVSNQYQQIVLGLIYNLQAVQQREREIRQRCQLEISRKLAQR